MLSLDIAFLVLFLGNQAVAYPGSVDNLLQRRARTVTVTQSPVTVTQTVTATLTTCLASYTTPSSSTVPVSSTVPTTSTVPTSSTKPSSSTAPTSSTAPVSASTGITQQGSLWDYPGVGQFTKKAAFSFNGNSLPDGLYASSYTVQDTANGAPQNHLFTPSNVKVANGYVGLVVPGGQSSSKGSTIKSAEICTTDANILYGVVEWTAILSNVPGTCHGGFFYKNDNQEIDIEILTDPTSLSNNGASSPIPMWYSNQATNPGSPATQSAVNPPVSWADLTTNPHRYKIVWMPTYTAFYFDDQLQTVFTDNVPSQPGSWIWNNWSNGDKGWSVGPPKQDNVFQIKDIIMYYNTTSG